MKLNKKQELIQRYTDLLLSNSEFHGWLLLGEGGLGKTYLTTQRCKERLGDSDFSYYNGHLTPLSLYLGLLEDKDKKVIILDDIDGLLTNLISIGILKSALSPIGNKRVVQYHTTHKVMDDTPSYFEITAKIIIICNSIPKKTKADILALFSRMLIYSVSFTHQEKLMLMKEYLKSRADLSQKIKDNVLKLMNKYLTEATVNFNFRLIQKAIAISQVKERGFRDVMFSGMISEDKSIKQYITAMKKSYSKKQAIIHYVREFGKSRASFYRAEQKYINQTGKTPAKLFRRF